MPALDWDSRIGRRLRLRDLHILFSVVEYGGMSAAGAHLNMSQSAVSQAVAALEDALKVRLLDRTPQGIKPTIYADAIMRRGNVVFDELRSGVKDIEFLADPDRGEVRIACADTLAGGILAPVVETFSKKYPQVVFEILQSNSFTHELLRVASTQGRSGAGDLAALGGQPGRGLERGAFVRGGVAPRRKPAQSMGPTSKLKFRRSRRRPLDHAVLGRDSGKSAVRGVPRAGAAASARCSQDGVGPTARLSEPACPLRCPGATIIPEDQCGDGRTEDVAAAPADAHGAGRDDHFAQSNAEQNCGAVPGLRAGGRKNDKPAAPTLENRQARSGKRRSRFAAAPKQRSSPSSTILRCN